MRKVLAWTGMLLLALLALTTAAAVSTANTANPDLYPAPAADGGAQAYMVYGRWTASLILPTDALVSVPNGPAWTRISCDIRRPWSFALLPGDTPLAGEVGAVRLTLSAKGGRALAERLEKSFGGKRQRVGPGVWKSTDPMLKNRLCGPWLGALLNAAGVPTTPVLDVVPAGLSQDLVWRAGAVKLDRPGPSR